MTVLEQSSEDVAIALGRRPETPPCGPRHGAMSCASAAVSNAMTSILAIEATGLVKASARRERSTASTWRCQRGGVYGVLGPNGAGKTTTIRMLATLLRPDAGSARVLGHDIVGEADAVRGLVSLTGQLASVDDDLTGRENLILLARLLGYPTRQARGAPTRCSAAFGLEEAGGRLVKNFSGGMRRRLDLAASIVVTPELMFLDEPTTGLDPRSRNQVWDIVRALVPGWARRCCSARSTSTRPTSSPTASPSSTAARSSPRAPRPPSRPPSAAARCTCACSTPSSATRRRGCSAACSGEPSSRPTPPRCPCASTTPSARRPRSPICRRARDQARRLLARPAEPRRGLPRAHRPPRRGRRHAGGGGMTTTAETSRPQPMAPMRPLHAALAAGARPAAPGRSRPPRRSAGAAC